MPPGQRGGSQLLKYLDYTQNFLSGATPDPAILHLLFVKAKGGSLMPDTRRITVEELKRRMEAGEDFTVIDVRNPQAWAESDTQIPEAIRVPLDELDENLSRIPKNRPVVAYCT
jgi:Rhodanese-like domain